MIASELTPVAGSVHMAMNNELTVDVAGTGSNLNPWPGNDSSSRIVMFTGQLGQALVVAGSTPRRCQTGVEREYGKYTFKIEMPCDASIVRVIDKYPRTVGASGSRYNTESMVVYEDYETQEVGILPLKRYHCRHQTFGFEFVQNYKNQNKLAPGEVIRKGTVFAHSPSVRPNGQYCYGLEVMTAAMSIPAVIEDGFAVSESLIKRLISKGIETRVASWGSEYYPLNLYGDENNYKPFPDIGEKVREDGLVFALRRYDPLLCVVEMTPEALMTPDYTFDRLFYAEPGAEVVNVDVIHVDGQNHGTTPVGMETQTEKYHEAELQYRERIYGTYLDLKKKRRDGLRISPEFHNYCVRCISDNPNAVKQRVMKTYRRKPLDDWRVELTLMHDIVPNIGFKLTDCHGGKGVICEIRKDEDMPVDDHGNRAELIFAGETTIGRMNAGRLYEQYINSSASWVARTVKQQVADNVPQDKIWEYLLGFYYNAAPVMHEIILSTITTQDKIRQHIQAVVDDGIYLYVPPHGPTQGLGQVRNLHRNYPHPITPVTYTGPKGNVVRTKMNVIVGSMYFLLLEKTGHDWAASASPKRQHFGCISVLTAGDRHSAPGREQATRVLGEAEVRHFNATVGSAVTADLMDTANNPAVHKAILDRLYRSPTPTDIPVILDRKEHPIGFGRPLVYAKHLAECSGFRFVRAGETDEESTSRPCP